MVKVKKVRALSFMQGTTLSLLKQSILIYLTLADLQKNPDYGRTYHDAIYFYFDLRSLAGFGNHYTQLSRSRSIHR